MTALAHDSRFRLMGVHRFLADRRNIATLGPSPNRPYPHP